jgi:hypothetical protein
MINGIEELDLCLVTEMQNVPVVLNHNKGVEKFMEISSIRVKPDAHIHETKIKLKQIET